MRLTLCLHCLFTWRARCVNVRSGSSSTKCVFKQTGESIYGVERRGAGGGGLGVGEGRDKW